MTVKRRMCAMTLALVFLLTGCVRVVNEIRNPGDNSSEAGATEEGATAARVRESGEAPSDEETDAATGARSVTLNEPEPEIAFRLTISEETYDDIDTLIANRLFAVQKDGKWGVIGSDGKEVYAAEYDAYATDGRAYFSLSRHNGDAYDARLYYVAESDNAKPLEIFSNEAYPSLDIVTVNPPYLMLSSRDAGDLHVAFAEWDKHSDSEFAFFLISSFNREDAVLAGFSAHAWEEITPFFLTMTSDGGAFISSNEWEEDQGFCFNIIGVDGLNQIVLSVEERRKTIQMFPYVPNEQGWYACYMIDSEENTRRPAFGNVKTAEYSTHAMRPFPEETKNVVADLSSFYRRAGRTDRIVLENGDGKQAIYNMKTVKPETGFDYVSVLLPESTDYPALVDDGESMGYLAYGKKEVKDTYAQATLFDETYGIALVCDDEGGLYLVDPYGKRMSEIEEGYADATLRYLYGEESHTFCIVTDGQARLCRAEEF